MRQRGEAVGGEGGGGVRQRCEEAERQQKQSQG